MIITQYVYLILSFIRIYPARLAAFNRAISIVRGKKKNLYVELNQIVGRASQALAVKRRGRCCLNGKSEAKKIVSRCMC